jgi:hypothetical protein
MENVFPIPNDIIGQVFSIVKRDSCSGRNTRLDVHRQR